MTLRRLLPEPGEQPLLGTYLQLDLHRQAAAGDLLLYTNFIASLDGRISLPDESGNFAVPAAIANGRDWRLYQELAAQSEAMVVSGRYFRQLAAGKAQALLPVGVEPEYADLAAWRRAQGLLPQPDAVVVSRSLDLPLSALQHFSDRRILIVTVATAPAERMNGLRAAGYELLLLGEQRVDGAQLRAELVRRQFRSVYLIAGSELHATMIAAKAVDRLFLTTRLTLLGGIDFHTLLSGALPAPTQMQLLSLCFDASGQQLFAQFQVRKITKS